MLILLLLVFIACDDTADEMSGRRFVRIEKVDISLNTGEKIILKAQVDSLSSLSKSFRWSVIDENIASIETLADNSGILTALAEGSTLVKVESTDGELIYFSDLSVSGEKVTKILAIGNSFSEDAIENYLYDLANASGHKVRIGNMYIGGADLERHWNNASGNKPEYQLRVINTDGGRTSLNNAGLREVISGENWDYISFQEVSQRSGLIEGYQEYLPRLVEYAQTLTTNPDVKYVLHQTWAYSQDSNHDGFVNYNHDQMEMYTKIVEAVSAAKGFADINMVIPSGTAIQNGRTSYIGDRFTRDGYHLSLTVGRFTAASTWYESIFGDVLNNPFIPSGFSDYDSRLVKTAATKAVAAPEEVTVLTDFAFAEPNEFILEAPLFIDFGPDFTVGNYNNFRHPNDTRVANLIDENGENSKFAIEVTQTFQGTLSRGLQNILGYPTTASQDMFFSDGASFAESGLMLSNLNKEQRYTLVFYGSVNDHGTETEFRVTGDNEKIGYLDNDNNLGKQLILYDIEPAEDGTIAIRMKPGPNNIHNSRFYGINVLSIYPEGVEVPKATSNFVLEHPVYFDFGTQVAPAPFFHMNQPNNDPRFNLPDATGNNTGISLSVTARFNGENGSGAPDNTLGFPAEVSRDAFWSDASNPTSGFTLYNLNTGLKYKFVFFGSRDGVGDNRETKYEVVGANSGSGAHNASSNKSAVTVIDGIQPASDGTIDVILSAGPNNNNGSKFFYINAMIVAPEGHALPGM